MNRERHDHSIRPDEERPVEFVLEIGEADVRLRGENVDITARHSGLSSGLVRAINEIRSTRIRKAAPLFVDGQFVPQSGKNIPVRRVGELLTAAFMPDPIARALTASLHEYGSSRQTMRLGIASSGRLSVLPWETLIDPYTAQHLALHPFVNVYRRQATVTSLEIVADPLKIVVAISSPDDGGTLLDYESELRSVLTAVRGARHNHAEVHVASFATPDAVREAVAYMRPHILHISGHGSPGSIDLEDDDGRALKMTADQLADALRGEALPPIIVLAACHTNVAAAPTTASFAAALLKRGASAVVATETSVTDIYATRALAQFYAELAEPETVSIVDALANARRYVQYQLQQSEYTRDRDIVQLNEWAVLSLLAPSGALHMVHRPAQTRSSPNSRSNSLTTHAFPGREVGVFVGRRREVRRWPRELTSESTAGAVLYGIGGIGKTTLAEEIVASVRRREPGRVISTFFGEVSCDQIFTQLLSDLRTEMLKEEILDATLWATLERAETTETTWQGRLRILKSDLLRQFPTLMVLDNFEDTLERDGSTWSIRDPALAEMIAAIVESNSECRLLITSRYPFKVEISDPRLLSFRPVRPLTLAETLKLIWSMPGLDALPPAEITQVWRMVGGHPRALEYIDALLSNSGTTLSLLKDRLSTAIPRFLNPKDMAIWGSEYRRLDQAIATTLTLIADDVLLEELLHGIGAVQHAKELIFRTSVYRKAVDRAAIVFQLGQPDEAAAHYPDVGEAVHNIRRVLIEEGHDDPGLHIELDLRAIAPSLRRQLAPFIDVVFADPRPPMSEPPKLDELIALCESTSLLTLERQSDQVITAFVHRWTASRLKDYWLKDGDHDFREAHRRAADYWQWRVEHWTKNQDEIHDKLEARYHLVHAGDVAAVDKLTRELCKEFRQRGSWNDVSYLIAEVLRLYPARSSKHAFWIGQQASLSAARGDLPQAKRKYQQALDTFVTLKDDENIAEMHNSLGTVLEQLGEFDDARSQYQAALTINARLGAEVGMTGMAANYHQMGNLAMSTGDYSVAERRYRQSQEILARFGIEDELSQLKMQLGSLAQMRGRYGEAKELFEESLAIDRRNGNRAAEGFSYAHLAGLAHELGRFVEAEQNYQRSVDIAMELGDIRALAINYHNLGRLSADHGDLEDGEHYLERSLTLHKRIGDNPGQRANIYHLGLIATERDDYVAAERYIRASLALAEQLGDLDGEGSSHHQLGILAWLRNDYDSADRHFKCSLEIHKTAGAQAKVAANYYHLGLVARDSDAKESALTYLEQAAEINEDLQRGGAARKDLRTAAEVLIDIGQVELSVNMLLRARAFTPDDYYDGKTVSELSLLARQRQALGSARFSELVCANFGVTVDRADEMILGWLRELRRSVLELWHGIVELVVATARGDTASAAESEKELTTLEASEMYIPLVAVLRKIASGESCEEDVRLLDPVGWLVVREVLRRLDSAG